MAKRKWLRTFVWLMCSAFLVLAGCSSGNKGETEKASPNNNAVDSSSASGEPVELVWLSGKLNTEDDRVMVQDKIIGGFEKLHPTIKIKFVEAQDPYVLTRQQLAAGAGPDIIATGGPTFLQEYVKANYLLPLNKYAEKYGWKDKFYSWAYETGTAGDELYGLPGSYEALVVWYNKDLFAENNWQVPTTFNELKTIAEAAKSKNIIPFAFGTSDFRTVNEWWISQALNAYVGSDELKKVLKGEQPWTSELVKKGIEEYVNMWENGYINDKKSFAITMDDAWDLFDNKKTAMKLEGTWALSRILDEGTKPPFNIGFFVMPAWRDGIKPALPLGIGDAMAINAKSKHPDEVAAFLDYFYSNEIAQEYVKLGQFFPINGLNAHSIDGIDPLVAEVFDSLDKNMKDGNVGYVSWTYFPPSALSYLWNNIETVFLKKLSVDSFLEKTQQAADKDKANGLLFHFND